MFSPRVSAATGWSKTYGGTESDTGTQVLQTSEGGYAIAAYTSSFGTGGVGIQPWLIKTDAAGNVQWNKTYGEEGGIAPWGMCQTGDGGYALAGSTTGLENTDFWAVGVSDYWLVKTDSAGNVQWVKTYGGTSDDYGQCMVQTNDGGYALMGYTDSFGAGSTDFYLVKTDASGNMQWNKTYGGQGSDYGTSVVQAKDGGYALAGATIGLANNTDIWVVKTDASGNMQWNKTYGGTGIDEAHSLVSTSDGGYAIGCFTRSFGSGGMDFYLVKIDASGNMQWSKTYGGAGDEFPFSMVQTNDGGYAMTGYTLSFGVGKGDFWLVKTDAYGTMQWNKTYGGMQTEWAYSVIQTNDGGYALTGDTGSFGAGDEDVWLVKVDEFGVAPKSPTSTPEWSKTFGGDGGDAGSSLVQTKDGGYAIAGTTNNYGSSTGDAWLVKTDASGTLLWNRTYGGATNDDFYSVVQTSDGGYAMAGSYSSWSDMYLVRTDANGDELWSRTYLNPYNSYYLHDAGWARSLIQTSDGGFVMVGDINLAHFNVWLVKTDPNGNMQWNKAYSEVAAEAGKSVVQTTDGGYAIAGEDTKYMHLIKTDANGVLQWNRTFGEADYNNVGSLVQTVDGGYAMVGTTHSYVAGTRVLLVKTDEGGNLQWSRTYDEAGDFLTIGGSVVQTSDQGYALAATIWNYDLGAGGYDVWLAQVDPNGNMKWNQTYGGTGHEIAGDMIQTSDGGYAFVGSIGPSYGGATDVWLVKVDASGVIPELPPWMLLSLVLAATGFIAIGKRRLFRSR